MNKTELINAIAEKLALAVVQDAKLYKGITDREPENWRDYLRLFLPKLFK